MRGHIGFVNGFVMMVMLLAAGRVAALEAHSTEGVPAISSGMGEESLAPPPAPVKPAGSMAVGAGAPLSATAPVSAAAPAVASATVPVPAVPETSDIYTVSNVVTTLADTAGFARDAALEKGARQSLPTVLGRMGMPEGKISTTVANLGSALRFVKSYKIGKEALIPTYSLTADYTFNGPMLAKNFGVKLAAPTATAGGAVVAASTPAPLPRTLWVVRLHGGTLATVDGVRKAFNTKPDTVATYRFISTDTTELLVNTPLSQADIQAVAGTDAEVLAPQAAQTGKEEPAATPATPAMPQAPQQPELRPWQGTDDKADSATYDADTGTTPDDTVPNRPWFPWHR